MNQTNKALLFLLAVLFLLTVSITVNISLASLMKKRNRQVKDADDRTEYVKDVCRKILQGRN